MVSSARLRLQPKRSTTSATVNGPWVRAYLESKSPGASSTDSRNTPAIPTGNHHAECIAVPGRVLDRNQARLRRDSYAEHALLGDELANEPSRRLRRAHAYCNFVRAEIAHHAQKVDDVVGVFAGVGEPLQVALVFGEHFWVEKLTKLGLANQLAKLRMVDAKRLNATLGERRVGVVDKVGDERKQKRRCERRRRVGVDGHDANATRLDPSE